MIKKDIFENQLVKTSILL